MKEILQDGVECCDAPNAAVPVDIQDDGTAIPSASPAVKYGHLKHKSVPSRRVLGTLNECLCGQVLGLTYDQVIQ